MAARKAKKAKVEEAPITPLKLPRGVKTLVVYGGSFDPPHEYHLVAWGLAWTMFGNTARTLYVPASRNPLKERGPIAADDHRVAMLIAGCPLERANLFNGFGGVWTDEIDRANWHRDRGDVDLPSYTIDTVRRLRTLVPKDVTLRLLIGSDQVLAFHKWKEWRALLREAEPLIALREPARTPKALVDQLDPRIWSIRERLAWASRIAPFEPIPRSSTQVRDLIVRQPLSFAKWEDEAKFLVPHQIASYIIKHRLYGVGTKYKPTRLPPRSAKGDRAAPRKK